MAKTIIIVIVIAVVIMIGAVFATEILLTGETQLGKVGKVEPKGIGYYPQVAELIVRGFNERDVEVRGILVKILDNDPAMKKQYVSECSQIYESYLILGVRADEWVRAGNDPKDNPDGGLILDHYVTINGVCAFFGKS